VVYYLNNILSKIDCIELFNKFKKEKKNSSNLDLLGGHMININSTYGFVPSEYFSNYLEKLKPKIESYFDNKKLISSNVFIREYKNDSFLNKHVDRNGLSIGLSICLHNNTTTTWPLYVEYNDSIKRFDCKIGDGILITDATHIPHWREVLKCEDSQSITQLFLHWNIDNSKTHKTLF